MYVANVYSKKRIINLEGKKNAFHILQFTVPVSHSCRSTSSWCDPCMRGRPAALGIIKVPTHCQEVK